MSGAAAPLIGRETRAFPMEVRATVGASGRRRLEGYISLFNVRADIDGETEVIRRGAFAGSLASNRDILALVDHDASRLLGRTRSGSLRLAEDSVGLAFDLDVPDTTLGRDVLTMAERNDLGGASFGFTVAPGGERREAGVRVLTGVTLYEVSVIHAFPAYAGTSVNARALRQTAPPDLTRLAFARLALEALR
jgi:HK97 family phage prohead protease